MKQFSIEKNNYILAIDYYYDGSMKRYYENDNGTIIDKQFNQDKKPAKFRWRKS